MNILFVDDDRPRAELLTRAACRLGHLSSAAYTNRSAVEYANDSRFDVVVINIASQVKNVMDVGSAIRRRGLSSHVVLVRVKPPETCSEADPLHEGGWVSQPIGPADLAVMLHDYSQ